MKTLRARRGTSLVEVLIAIAVTAILSGIVIVYGAASRRQVTLYVDTVRLAETILRAKSQSVLTYYNPAASTCGYGVRILPAERAYALFRYAAGEGGTCETIPGVGDENYVQIEKIALQRDVGIAATVDDILFVPPDPKTYLWNGGARVPGGGEVRLSVNGGAAERVVAISTGGQVTY